MTILVLLLDSSDVPSQLSWATRFGTALEEDLVVACAASDLRDTVESELASRGFQILTDDDEPAAESTSGTSGRDGSTTDISDDFFVLIVRLAAASMSGLGERSVASSPCNSDTFWISETGSDKSRKYHYFTFARRTQTCRPSHDSG